MAMTAARASLLLPFLRDSPPRAGVSSSLGLPPCAGGTLSSNLHRVGGRTKRNVLPRAMTDDRVDLDENPEGIISGEWPENFSLLSYDDLRAYLETQIVDDQIVDDQTKPLPLLRDVMSTTIRAVTVDQTLEEIDHHFEFVSGLPVVDHELKCIGIISKNDRTRALHGLKSKVAEFMSSPAMTLTPDKTVTDAAALMLKMKIHRIPVLNEEGQVIGMGGATFAEGAIWHTGSPLRPRTGESMRSERWGLGFGGRGAEGMNGEAAVTAPIANASAAAGVLLAEQRRSGGHGVPAADGR